MKLAHVEINGVLTPALVHTNNVLYDLPRLLKLLGGRHQVPGNMLDAAMSVGELRSVIATVLPALLMDGTAEEAEVPNAVRLLAPVPRPNRVFAIGRNYAAHAQERGAAVSGEPIVFLKASQTVIAPSEPIRIPEGIGRVDYEAELLVVLGAGGKNVSEAHALTMVAGYTVFNDVTARDLQNKAQENRHPWFLSKSLDTFGPMGPYLVTADDIPDPQALRIELSVNGETKQSDTTASMIFPVSFLIAYLSRFFTLEPGDVIATGTPAGVGAIVPGDTVSVTIDGIGTLTNPVQAA